MASKFKSATLLPSGHVSIEREIDGRKWRRAIEPHDEGELDTFAPEISANDKQTILDKWATIPVVTPEPPEPPPSNGEIYDQVMQNQAVLKAVVLAFIKGKLVVGMTPAQAKTVVKAEM